MYVLSLNNRSLQLLSCLVLLVTSIFGSYVLAPYQNVDAQEATPADQPSSTFASSNNESSTTNSMENDTGEVSGMFDMSTLESNVDFKIDLPEGWTGIHQFAGSYAAVSPEGVNESTLSVQEPPLFMTISTSNPSEIGELSAIVTNSSSHEDFTRYSAEMIRGCQLLDYSVVKINNANTVQSLEQCGTGEDEDKQKDYLFNSGDKLIRVSLKGTTASFDENLPKFEQSIQSVKINKPGDTAAGLRAVFNPTTPTG